MNFGLASDSGGFFGQGARSWWAATRGTVALLGPVPPGGTPLMYLSLDNIVDPDESDPDK